MVPPPVQYCRPSRLLLPAVCLLLLLAGSMPAESQTSRPVLRPAVRATKPPRGSIVLNGGIMVPMAHRTVADFWEPGPSISLSAYRNVNRLVALGIGGEAALFSFDAAGFGRTYPGVIPHPLKLGYLHLFVGWKFTMFPAGGFTPTLGATIGASKLTKALHQERILGVRTTYYEIPGRFRLTGAGTFGVEVAVSRMLAFGAEGRILYLLNDPEASVLMTGRLTARLLIE